MFIPCLAQRYYHNCSKNTKLRKHKRQGKKNDYTFPAYTLTFSQPALQHCTPGLPLSVLSFQTWPSSLIPGSVVKHTIDSPHAIIYTAKINMNEHIHEE